MQMIKLELSLDALDREVGYVINKQGIKESQVVTEIIRPLFDFSQFFKSEVLFANKTSEKCLAFSAIAFE